LQKELIHTCSHRNRKQSKACSHRRVLKKLKKPFQSSSSSMKVFVVVRKIRGTREADDDSEDVRVLFSSNSDDGEDGDDDGDGSDDNNGGNNAAYGETYGVGGSQ